MSEARETVTIANQRGLHARVNAVTMLPADLSIRVLKDGNEAVGGSILGLMMLGAAKGDTIEIVVSGEGAEAALSKLVGLVMDGFGED